MSSERYEQVGWCNVGPYGRVFHDLAEHARYVALAVDDEARYLAEFVPVYVKVTEPEPERCPTCAGPKFDAWGMENDPDWREPF